MSLIEQIEGINKEGIIINRPGLETIFEKYNFPTCWKTKSIKILNYKDVVQNVEMFEKMRQLYVIGQAFVLERFMFAAEIKMFAIYTYKHYEHPFDNCKFWNCEIFYLE
jgi:hypothetical protein